MKLKHLDYEEIADILKVISHPVRLKIIELLNEKKRLNVTEIYEQLGLNQPEASAHLARLRKCSILKTEREQVTVYYMMNSSFVSNLMKFMVSNYFK